MNKNEKYKVVDWRFWRWPATARKWHELYVKASDDYLKAKQEAERWKLTAFEQRAEAEARASALGMRSDLAPRMDAARLANDAEVRAAFEGVHDGTKWWVMLNHVLERRTREEMGLAVLAGSSAEERHYRAGAAASLMDLTVGMHRLKVEAQATSVAANAAAPQAR